MKIKSLSTALPILAFTTMSTLLGGMDHSTESRTTARHVPERADDFAWENDKVAFRTFGPELRNLPENSGIDCWLKRVDYPIIDKWFKEWEVVSYHDDRGEGHDPYHVGSSRGCGGLGLWIDGELVTSNTYVEWEVIKSEPEESIFVLTYEWEHAGDTYREDKQISIRLGDRLFKSVSTFWKNGDLATGLPIAIGLTTHDEKASVSKDLSQGWMACWETIEGFDLGTGVVMDPELIDSFIHYATGEPDMSHALLITKTNADGLVEYRAGFGWERQGEITSLAEWQAYLASF